MLRPSNIDASKGALEEVTMNGNQIRLWLASVAYCLLNDLRELGLKGTRLAKAQCGTIRTRLLKMGVAIRISVRRVLIRMAKSCPLQNVFEQALLNLRNPATGST